ncbi:MAG: glutaredoxin family protein [Actinomycetota bacterium]|nr:glutaredoxin family protein [Actinomycetota bacterium]
MRTLVLYARPDCHLCDEARAMIRPLVRAAGDIDLRVVDIEGDDALFRKYLERIPVIELEGVMISELVPDQDSISAALLHTSPR